MTQLSLVNCLDATNYLPSSLENSSAGGATEVAQTKSTSHDGWTKERCCPSETWYNPGGKRHLTLRCPSKFIRLPCTLAAFEW